MIRSRSILVATLACPALACFGPLPPSCDDEPGAAIACHRAAALFRYLTPQLSRSLVAANPTPGMGGVLPPGRPFSASASVRVSGAHAPLVGPQSGFEVNASPQTATVARVDATLGVIPRLAGIAGVDILLAASSVSRSSTSGLATVEAPSTSIGYGLRFGLAQTRKSPALALTTFMHEPRRYDLTALTDGETMQVSNMNVRAASINVSTGYQWRRVGFAAGLGQVMADAEATVRGTSDGFSSPTVSVWYVASTTNAFIDGTLKLGRAHLVVGVGRTGRMTDEHGSNPGYTVRFAPEEASSTVLTVGTRIGG